MSANSTSMSLPSKREATSFMATQTYSDIIQGISFVCFSFVYTVLLRFRVRTMLFPRPIVNVIPCPLRSVMVCKMTVAADCVHPL